jgi:hypothetical protein
MKHFIIGLITAGMGFSGLVGCTSMHSPHPEAAQVGIMCDKCKTTWVTRGVPGSRSVRYTQEKAMVCPDCKSAVENWIATGELKHTCTHCKGHMTCEKPKEN